MRITVLALRLVARSVFTTSRASPPKASNNRAMFSRSLYPPSSEESSQASLKLNHSNGLPEEVGKLFAIVKRFINRELSSFEEASRIVYKVFSIDSTNLAVGSDEVDCCLSCVGSDKLFVYSPLMSISSDSGTSASQSKISLLCRSHWSQLIAVKSLEAAAVLLGEISMSVGAIEVSPVGQVPGGCNPEKIGCGPSLPT